MASSTITAPTRSSEQREAALLKANRIRVLRSELKRDIQSAGQVAVLVLDPPWFVESMKVTVLLGTIPRVGPVRVRRIMLACHVSETKTVGGLSVRQRDELAKAVRS